MRKRFRVATAFVAAATMVAAVLMPLAIQSSAWAGAGSRVDGTVWADTDRDGTRDAGEPARAGVTVVLVDASGTPVPGFSATTAANGSYAFTNVPDGDYRVRVDAPGAFTFPAAAGGDNDFASTGAPAPNDPQRGASAQFTVAGGSQHTGLDAGLRPIADLRVQQLPGDGCGGALTVTGGVSAPFDTTGTDGEGGVDLNGTNCFVRTRDTVTQDFAVDLTNLPENGEVDNVIFEFVLRANDGARIELVGPNASGLPAGCLAAGQGGANPGSSATTDPVTGDITIRCNVGSLQNQLTTVQVAYRHLGDTAIPSSVNIEAHAYAAGGDAGVSNQVTGPEVFVTGRASWALAKTQNTQPGATLPGFRDVPGLGRVQGMFVNYLITVLQPDGVTGNGALDGWFDFVDQMTQFPNAVIHSCARVGSELWQPTCETGVVAGADGWNMSIDPVNSGAASRTGDRVQVTIFIPQVDLYRLLDPSWQPGDDRPTGTASWENHLTETDGWAMNGGEPNNGDGFEDGWDGTTATGDNVVPSSLGFTDPEWDLAKNVASGPTYIEDAQNIPGVPNGSKGYEIWYNLNVTETNGALLAPFIDDVTFNDVLRSHPNGILVECRTTPNTGTGTTTCDTGAQDADGWEFHFEPSETGISQRRGLMQARFFIPMEDPEFDPCVMQDVERLVITNDAQDSEGWTADGEPINPDSDQPGTEPGWGADEIDADVATGNNTVTVDRPYNQTVSANFCGTLTGNKVWENNPTVTWPGRAMGTLVTLSATSDRVVVKDPMVCDVWDVSMLRMVDQAYGADQFTRVDYNSGLAAGDVTLDPANYIVEYAAGPNATQTQATPADVSSLQDAAQNDCSAHDGEWFTDPRDFGADWQDHINMIRIRPIVWGEEEAGPFNMSLRTQLTTRGVYNGGPNAGEPIPDNVRVTNVGSWADRDPETDELQSVTRTVPFQGARIAVGKTVTPTQYFPGDQVIWDLNMQVTQAMAGTELTDLRLVDTLPVGLSLDLACTLQRLPAGVDVAFNVAARTATFIIGDVTTTANPHWVVHPTVAGALRLQLCARVSALAASGDTFTNSIQGFARETPDSAVAISTIQIIGPGQLGIEKGVDKPYVASGEQYTWNLDWGNTSTTTAFANPDIIDVLPWNGDAQPGVGSQRSQFGSDFTGTVDLTGPLAAPTYRRGGTGVGNDVPGTWYYTTAASNTLNHDPRAAANANPAAPGGLWLTAAEVSDFAAVTGIRFVSSTAIAANTRIRAEIPSVSTTSDLDVYYVNRGAIFTATSPDALLLSNEPVVQIPGFSLGDLVWIERDGDGRFTEGVDEPVAGVEVEVLDENDRVVGTVTTDANGRWQVTALPAGTYRARIPASEFQAGGPLERFQVKTTGSSGDQNENEGDSNSNTATADPRTTGLVSSPVTLAYTYEGEGEDRRLIGANGPTDDDVANLAPPQIAAEFTNFTVDLALAPAPGVDIEKYTNTIDADDPTGPYITPGGEVEWTYVVTNTGSTELFDIHVTDDMVASSEIDCGDGTNVIAGPLAIDASVTCTATGTATSGQYTNLGTVDARGPLALGPDGDPLPPEDQDPRVNDRDRSHYFGADPAVDIQKLTNGEDANEAPGVQVPVGGAVRWAYIVTNTGNVPLTDVTVTDDKVDASEIDCGDGTNVIPGTLAVGATVTCTAEGVATEGQYVNMGTVVGTGPTPTGTRGEAVASPRVVTANDPSHYFGVSGLAFTGGQLSASIWMLAAALLLTGAALYIVHRRRSRSAE